MKRLFSLGKAGISHPDSGRTFSTSDTITLQTCQSPDVYTNKVICPSESIVCQSIIVFMFLCNAQTAQHGRPC